ncbi:protein kinase [Paenibacillus sp. TAF43_2]|uniref:protein kinase domain-containing protein n=1 Tax=Paenibacillus sp. TAF43_2 TaxID=3233069 RepID=UPI003F9448CE
MKVKTSHPKVIEKLSKSFAGDEGPFPRRSGPLLVEFFNNFGYEDKYRSGFPTRWRYAEERIADLEKKGRIEQFIDEATSIEELLKFNEVSLEYVENLQDEIIEYLNAAVFNITDRHIVKVDGRAKLVRKAEEKPIGEGAFAEVYRLNRESEFYALKQLKREYWSDTEMLHRFKREYEIMKRYNASDRTISVWNYKKEKLSFEMEYADKTLKEYIDEHYHVMNLEWQEHLCEEIILSLNELHPETIHRDLSYNNVLMVKNKPKLADFGLGKDTTRDYSYKTITERGVGTAHFTDPIQLNNIKDACIQTDIYSLGKIIDFVFCGSVVSREHKYSAIVTKATNKDLSKRYSTVGELYDAFVSLKNTPINYNPVDELRQMVREKKISSEKIYSILTRRNVGAIVTELIIADYAASLEIFEVFVMQYEHELEEVFRAMYDDLVGRRLPFPEYDKFGKFSISMLIEISGYSEATVILSEVLEFVASDKNRYPIQRLIKENRNNKQIPAIIRERWETY